MFMFVRCMTSVLVLMFSVSYMLMIVSSVTTM